MSLPEILKKELYVALHAQTTRFRIVKYVVIFSVTGLLYWWKGWEVVGLALGFACICAIAMHFFFRWMSNGWENDWWLYKSVLNPPIPRGSASGSP